MGCGMNDLISVLPTTDLIKREKQKVLTNLDVSWNKIYQSKCESGWGKVAHCVVFH